MATDVVIWNIAEEIKDRAAGMFDGLENEGDFAALVEDLDWIMQRASELRGPVQEVINVLAGLK